jgi:hypothetical protein
MGLSGVGVLSEKSDKWILLGEYYYEHEKDYNNAFECFKTDLMQNGFSNNSMERFIASSKKLDKYDEAQTLVNIFQLDKIRTIKTEETLESDQVYSASKHTDENWVSGVARSWATAFFLKNTIQARNELVVGKKITFSDGTVRTIVNTKEDGESLIVFLDGKPLDGTIVGFPKKFIVYNSSQNQVSH